MYTRSSVHTRSSRTYIYLYIKSAYFLGNDYYYIVHKYTCVQLCLIFFHPTNKAITGIDEPKSLFNPTDGGDVYIISDLFLYTYIYVYRESRVAIAKQHRHRER